MKGSVQCFHTRCAQNYITLEIEYHQKCMPIFTINLKLSLARLSVEIRAIHLKYNATNHWIKNLI